MVWYIMFSIHHTTDTLGLFNPDHGGFGPLFLDQVQTRNPVVIVLIRGSTGDGYRCRSVIRGCKMQKEDNPVINHQTPQHKGAYRFLAAAARSLCLRFLNQFPTCVGVSPVAWASSLFLLGLG